MVQENKNTNNPLNEHDEPIIVFFICVNANMQKFVKHILANGLNFAGETLYADKSSAV